MIRPADRSRLIGVCFVALSATGFGAMAIFAKLAYGQGVDVETMLLLRFAIAGALMAVIVRWQGLSWPRGRHLAILVAMGALGYVGQSFCFFSALKYASAGLTALLLYLYPALVTVITAVRTRRWLGGKRLAAVLAALAGTALIVSGDASGSLPGVLFGIGAALIYSVYIVVGEQVTQAEGATTSASVVMLAAAVVYGVMVAGKGPVWPTSATGWLAILAIAVLSTAVAIVGFFAGMRRLGAADASTLSTLEPVTTVILAAIFLGEAVRPLQILGGAVVLTAVIVLVRHRDGRRRPSAS